MVRYANKDYLSCQDLRLFLETEQGMVGVTTSNCESIINHNEPCYEARNNSLMTIDGFTSYLFSEDCGIFDQNHRVVTMDMKQPFSHYYISSSRKTYLVEDQLGPTSPDGLTSALKRNCRLIELDIWDPNESCGECEPIIQNGLHAQSKIPISDALKTIRENGFERSRYPLLLKLSVHCSLDWQKVAAKLIVMHLGSKLYLPEFDTTDWKDESNIPTPWDFQNRIIIISKKLQQDAETGEVSDDDDLPTNRKKESKKLLCREISDLVPAFFKSSSLSDLLPNSPGSQSRFPPTEKSNKQQKGMDFLFLYFTPPPSSPLRRQHTTES
ncbi:unnamed protein product [Caenorhabditis sp. 36 PRJEB53466]|nr:unnamed protein product [Caenorhabditis sp. 36 PRJEB53466]